jgi:nitric oxide reductase NorE protein
MSDTLTARDFDGAELGKSSPVRARHTPGEVGIWILVLGEMFEFALFFGVLTYQRLHNPEDFAESRLALNPTLGMINTILLLTGSLLVAVGASAARQQKSDLARRMFLAAGACGLGFAFIKLGEYGHLVSAGIYPNTNDFFLYYYVFTGMHMVHLIVGIGALAYVRAKVRKPVLSPMDIRTVENGATFWHLVDLLWVALFPILYLVS